MSEFITVTASEKDTRSIVAVLQNAMRGKLNCTTTKTLTASSATTTITDTRIGPESVLLFMPTTANAATGLTALYVSARGNGTATLTHANNAQVDRTYAIAIIG